MTTRATEIASYARNAAAADDGGIIQVPSGRHAPEDGHGYREGIEERVGGPVTDDDEEAFLDAYAEAAPMFYVPPSDFA